MNRFCVHKCGRVLFSFPSSDIGLIKHVFSTLTCVFPSNTSSHVRLAACSKAPARCRVSIGPLAYHGVRRYGTPWQATMGGDALLPATPVGPIDPGGTKTEHPSRRSPLLCPFAATHRHTGNGRPCAGAKRHLLPSSWPLQAASRTGTTAVPVSGTHHASRGTMAIRTVVCPAQ